MMTRRSRSRSPGRHTSTKESREDRSSRRRDDDRKERKSKKEKRRRHRSSSSEASDMDNKLGSILHEKRSKREKSSENGPRVPAPTEVDLNAPFDLTSMSDAAKKWLEDRITEQVTSRVDKLEALMAEKATTARFEMEKMLRAQIANEMSLELSECRKRDEESRKRCEQLESELQKKIKLAEESQRKHDEGRLEMLDQRSLLERERAELARQKAELEKSEQQTILNKGGGARAPIKFKFGK